MTDRHAPAQRRAVWPPEPGYFLVRLVRGGWRVPARIVQNDDGRWQAIVDGVTHAAHREPAHAAMLAEVWHSGFRITEADYHFTLAIIAQARAHTPDHPALHPERAIDPRRLRPIHSAPRA